jgi:hypothetical protein
MYKHGFTSAALVGSTVLWYTIEMSLQIQDVRSHYEFLGKI